MHDKTELARLLARHNDLAKSVFLDDIEYLMTGKYKPEEWILEAKKLKKDSEDFVDCISRNDNELAQYIFQWNQNADIENYDPSADFGARRSQANDRKANLEYAPDEPFKGYFKTSRELAKFEDFLLWLKNKYGCADVEQIIIFKQRGIFGDVTFELNTDGTPNSIRYKDKTLMLQPKQRNLALLIFEKCYYDNSDISIDYLKEKFNDVRKNVSYINKAFTKAIDRSKKENILLIKCKDSHFYIDKTLL